MSRRHTLARPLIGIGAAGAAGLAGVLGLAPAAHAAPTDAPSTTAASGSTTTAPAKKKVAVDEIVPSYGTQKFRVGVRGKDGDYFPGGTTTAGTTLHVVETPEKGTATSFDCTTVANDPNVVEEATFCPGEQPVLSDERRLRAANEPTPGTPSNVYYAAAGTTVTVTQTTVEDGLLVDGSTATLAPCELGPNPFLGFCGTSIGEGGFDPEATSTDVVFVDPGLPPVAGDDSARTKEGVAVPIAIASNDTPKAPVTGVVISADPKHGTARLIAPESPDPAPSTSTPPPAQTDRAAAGVRSLAAVTSYRAIYTPAAGFTGVDTFDYTITTANGTATARVTVTVTGSAASSSVSATGSSSSASSGTAPLADTGTQSGDLLGYAAALIAAGGGALAIGRQRRRGRHAR